ncbi:hypothetical protein [Burkholderia ambifaria]|uniref:hypothetical protein n=1 Tax=Burkholderia ambifaria TaxID=152480 RepID=UPI001ABADF4F|nr:hypothetical protein [Burkholderia ambifaria]
MSELDEYKAAVEKHGSIRAAARELGISETRIRRRLKGVPEASEMNAARAGEVVADGETRVAQMQAELRTLRAALSQRVQDELDEEFVKAKIIKLAATSPEPPAWLVPKKFAEGAPGVPTLFASDWHWAEVVDPRQIGGVNEFNLEIAHSRAAHGAGRDRSAQQSHGEAKVSWHRLRAWRRYGERRYPRGADGNERVRDHERGRRFIRRARMVHLDAR